MRIRAQTFVLGFGAALCFLEAVAAPKGSAPGSIAAAVLGILLVRRAIIVTPQPTVVIVAGCALTLLVVVADHGLVNINNPIWIALTLIGFVCYGFWERIEKLWRQRQEN